MEVPCEIPFFHRLIDCSFGVFGIVPMVLCRQHLQELIRLQAN